MITKCLGVIPARYQSARLPGKPLADIKGMTLVERVWRRASEASCFSSLAVATDDTRIREVCETFGAKVIMTGSTALTGSDRVAEAASVMEKGGESYDFVANVQGDMPFINPRVIETAVQSLIDASGEFGMSTIGTPITSEEEFIRPDAVKVVIGEGGRALYFSRAAIPHMRNKTPVNSEEPYGYKHLGLYIFRRETLRRLSSLKQTLPEKRESLEQLRALSNGIAIRVAIIPRELLEPSIEVDTPADLELARQVCR